MAYKSYIEKILVDLENCNEDHIGTIEVDEARIEVAELYKLRAENQQLKDRLQTLLRDNHE